jgi:hypothetical protein
MAQENETFKYTKKHLFQGRSCITFLAAEGWLSPEQKEKPLLSFRGVLHYVAL